MRLSPSLLTWLRCFEAAARLSSFTRAASDLHLTQGAVSQQIRLLERALECKLFDRHHRRLELTPRGRYLQGEIGPALQRIELAVATLHEPRGALQISCSPSFALLWLVPRLGRFAERYPQIGLNVRAEFHSLNRTSFLRDGLHAAIRYDPMEYTDLRAETLLEELLLPVASSGFLATHKRLASSFDLTGIGLLHDSVPWQGALHDTEWRVVLTALDAPLSQAQKNSYFNLASLALAAARSGEGLAAARLALVLDDLEAKRLVPVTHRAVPAMSRYVLLSTDDRDWRVEAFAKWLREECSLFDARRRTTVASAKISCAGMPAP